MGDGRDVLDDDLTIKLIGAGVMAGAYSAMAKRHPEAARGMEKMRASWRAKAATLANEICAGAARPMIEAAPLRVDRHRDG